MGITACDDDQALENGYYETTDDSSTVLVLKGYESTSAGFSVFQPDGFTYPFYLKDQCFYGSKYSFVIADATRLDAMTDHPASTSSSWTNNMEIIDNACYWARYSTLTDYTYIKFRVALISGNNVTIEYVIGDTESRPNTNANTNDGTSVTDWEIPYRDENNYYVEHYVTYNDTEMLNYALEWNSDMKHAAWVAYYFDEYTCLDNVSRTDAWDVDPLLPTSYQTDNTYHTSDGFDRGHICASEDRVYCEEANEQTFYYSNMSPQIGSFNQGFWAELESRVRTWGRSVPKTYDKVYITKGGTLNHLLKNFEGTEQASDGKYPTTDENGYTIKGLPCPQYYFMAVLSEKDGEYNAIAFLVEHQEGMTESPTSDELKTYVVTIDKLEEFTGIDFFCNVPDDVETEVESSYDVNVWAW